MLLNWNSQKPQSGQLVVKASGSCSPKLLSNPRLRTSGLGHCGSLSKVTKHHQRENNYSGPHSELINTPPTFEASFLLQTCYWTEAILKSIFTPLSEKGPILLTGLFFSASSPRRLQATFNFLLVNQKGERCHNCFGLVALQRKALLFRNGNKKNKKGGGRGQFAPSGKD